MFCSNCGKEIDDKAVVCVHCGVFTNNNQNNGTHSTEWLTTLLLCIFLGLIGAHNFYVRNTMRGIVQLLGFTIGWIFIFPPFLVAIFVIIELILIVTNKFKKADGTYLN